MANKLREYVTELQKNHTDREIGGALSEYFQIVKGVAADYTDEATVRNLRDDHPELDFMDDDELKDILKHAKTWRHKSDGREPAQPEHEPDKTDERLKRMEELHRERMEEARRREKTMITYMGMIAANRQDETAALLSALDDRTLEAKYKNYWDSWEERKMRRKQMSPQFKRKEFMKKCIKAHAQAFESWPYGRAVESWVDENGDFCIRYENNAWWHYRETDDGNIKWW